MILSLANVAVSWALMSLIWLVQLIIYPSFQRVAADTFSQYHRWYAKRISAIVIPLMAAEMLISLDWLSASNHSAPSIVALALVLIVWISTFSLQVPIHLRLASRKNDDLIRRLVATNWLRTAAWTIKAVWVTTVIVKAL
jgi:hypothetical protein